MVHSISLRAIRQIESHFKLNVDFKADQKTPIEISYETNISYKIDNNLVNVVVSVSSANEQQPFTFSVAVLGVFEFKEKPKDEDIDKIANINCASIIYPYLRESVADLSRRASLPPFHMDIINFVAMYEANKHESKSADTEKKDSCETTCKQK